MSTGTELLREHQYKDLWQRHCGFIDLSLPAFMDVQRRLLLEQLGMLKRCELGRSLMGSESPCTVDEFREQVPLTTYADYLPYLSEQWEEALPERPLLWQRTTGVSGEFEYKWSPITPRMYQEMGSVLFAILIFATSQRRGDIGFGDHEKMLYALAPPPYATGCWGRLAAEELPLDFLPSQEAAEQMPFEERLAQGLNLGLSQGMDLVFGLPSVLVALGEKISQRGQEQDIRSLLSRPRVLLRVGKAILKSKLRCRPLLPKDLWSLRGLAMAGKDSSVYRNKIREMWGKDPLDVYGCTEGLIIAMQTWDFGGMTFLPHLNFLEFIPESELYRETADPWYEPRTVLLDEVQSGERYEVVITNLLGGSFVRYRLGDIVTITALRNERLNIDIPQMTFYSRSDAIIDLAGFTRLTEDTIGKAIELAGLSCENWVARKEVQDTSILHLYLELRSNGHLDPERLKTSLHERLKQLDAPYADLELLLGLKPLQVTLLPSGTFQSYLSYQRASGADPAQRSSHHLNPSNEMMDALLGQVPILR